MSIQRLRQVLPAAFDEGGPQVDRELARTHTETSMTSPVRPSGHHAVSQDFGPSSKPSHRRRSSPTGNPASSTLLSFGQALLEDEPIDGLDLLSIEPHLIAQTILDVEDDAGEITLSRDVLARMLEDFNGIVDGALMCCARRDV